MNNRALATKIFRATCCGVLFFVAAAASFNGYYHKWHFREPGVYAGANPANGTETKFGLDDMLDGNAARPFVYRQLTPAIANWLNVVTPKRIQVALWARLGMYRLDSPMVFSPTYSYRYTVVYLATFLFSWLAVIAMYLVCKSLDMPPAARIFAPVVMILLVPYFLSVGGYLYDYPELAFLALAVWMGMTFDWWWMVPLVALATWNKESFLLVTLTLYPILRCRHSRVSALVGTGCLATTCAAVYLAIRSQFTHNPGGTLLLQWQEQLKFMSHPMDLMRMEVTYGITGFRAFSVFPLALLVWIVWRGWRLLPPEIQRHGQIAAAINIPLYFVFCMPGEMRDLSMLYIVFMSLLAATFANETKEMSPSALEDSAQRIAKFA